MDTFERSIGGTNAEYLDANQVAGEDDPSPPQPASPATTDSEGDIAVAYGSSTRASIDHRSVDERGAHASGRSWQKLSEACRLALVERSLRADFSDGFPAAL